MSGVRLRIAFSPRFTRQRPASREKARRLVRELPRWNPLAPPAAAASCFGRASPDVKLDRNQVLGSQHDFSELLFLFQPLVCGADAGQRKDFVDHRTKLLPSD